MFYQDGASAENDARGRSLATALKEWSLAVS
jgi:hypothetical protein